MRTIFANAGNKLLKGELDFNDPATDVRCLLLRDTGSYTIDKSDVYVNDVLTAGGIEISVASYARQALSTFAVNNDVGNKTSYVSIDQINFGSLESGQSVAAALYYVHVTDDTDSEVLWYDDGTINVISNALISSTLSGTVTNVTQANPGVVTFGSGHGLVNDDRVYLTGITGMTELNNRTFTLKNKSGDTFELESENTSGYTAYASGGAFQQVKYMYVDRLKDAVPDGTSMTFSGGESAITVGSSALDSRRISVRNVSGDIDYDEVAQDVRTTINFPIALSGGNFAINGSNLLTLLMDRS